MIRLGIAFAAGVAAGVLGMLSWSLYVALHAGGTVPAASTCDHMDGCAADCPIYAGSTGA